MKEVVDKLIALKRTISTMESCTGGALASTITDIEGSSEVFKFGAVTYANEYKIKMGVSDETIREHTVYSMAVANEMSKCICEYAKADYGIGITGKLKKADNNNPYGSDDMVYISIYDNISDKYYNYTMQVDCDSRYENKQKIVNLIANEMNSICSLHDDKID